MTTDGPGVAPAPDALFSRYRETGDAAALGRLFDGTAGDLFRVAMSLTPDAATAEDAVQETFLAAIEFAARWDGSRPVVPWLVGILRHKVEGLRRAAARGARGLSLPRDLPSLDPAGVVALREDADRVRAAMDALPEPYRQAALLRWRHGLDPAEIAHLTGASPGAIRVRLHRAMSRLRERIRGGAALALLPGVPRELRGLDAVRGAVVRRARRAWHAAPPSTTPSSTVPSATAALVAGGLLVGKKTVVAAVVVVALLVGGALWIASAPIGGGDRSTHDVGAVPFAGSVAPVARARAAVDDVAAASSVAAAPTRSAAFIGRVVDETGTRVAGAEIVATARRSPGESGAAPPPTATSRTGEDGAFDVRLPEGTEFADVVASHAGHAVTASERARAGLPVEIRLEREGVLRGRVLDLRGKPIAGATLRVFRVVGAEHVATERATSAEDGSYRIGGFGRARGPNGAPAPVRYQFLDVRAAGFGATQDHLGASPGPGEDVVRDVWLVATRPLEVRVVDGERGVPVPGATVTAGWAATGLQVSDPDGGGRILPHPAPWIDEGVTGADGTCRLADVPGQFPMIAHLVLRVWAPGFTAEALRLSNRRDIGEEPAVVTVWPATTLTGRVVDSAGAPVRGASIGVWAAKEGPYFPPAWFPVPFGEVEWQGVVTDADGRFTYRGVRATTAGDQPCRVTASLPYAPDTDGRAYEFGASVTVEVVPRRGATTEVPDFVVDVSQPTRSATLVVVDASGRPVADALVRASGSLTQTARTDAVGRALLRWPARAVAGMMQFGGEFVHVVSAGFARAVVLVSPDLTAPPEVRVVLRPGAVVTGRVVEASGDAVADATVHVSAGEHGAAWGESARTGPDGAFAFDGLPEQTVSVYASVGTRESGDGRGAPAQQVRPGGPPLTLVLAPAIAAHHGTVEATVVAADSGEPLVGANVVVACDPQERGAIPYDVRPGLFVIGAVPAGTWRVKATAWGRLPESATVTVAPRATSRLTFRLRRGVRVIVGLEIPAEAHTGAESIHAQRVDAAPGAPGAGTEPYLVKGDDGVLRGDALWPGRYRFRIRGGMNGERRDPPWVAASAVDVAESTEVVRVKAELVRGGSLAVGIETADAPEAPKSRSASPAVDIEVIDEHGERHALRVGAARGPREPFDLLPGAYVVRLHVPGQPARELGATVRAGEVTVIAFDAVK